MDAAARAAAGTGTGHALHARVLVLAGRGAQKELLWLRILQSPDERLRRCDWHFLDQRIGRTRPEVRRKLSDLGLIPYGGRYPVDEAYVHRCPQARDTATLHLNGAKAFRLADWMYRDAPDALVLGRKQAVYLRCREWREGRGLVEERRA